MPSTSLSSGRFDTCSRASAWLRAVAFVAAFSGCDVEPSSGNTGGLGLLAEAGTPTVTTDAGADAATSSATCARGLVVVQSDYRSTNVALARLDGTTLSASVISSASRPVGLSAALSGDVDVPSTVAASGRVVLLDRFGTNVITWLDPRSGSVLGQLPVGTGFESNPHDYVEVDARRAYVTRYGSNPSPGAQPFDEGGDVLIVDTLSRTVTGRIALPRQGVLLPRPSGAARVGDRIVVVLQRSSIDFKETGSSVLVGLEPSRDAIAWEHELTGLESCGRIAIAPDGGSFAVACAGRYDAAAGSFDAAKSDVVILSSTGGRPTEVRRLGLAAKVGAAMQGQVSFASARSLIAGAYGASPQRAGDRLVHIDLESGAWSTLATAAKPYVYGTIACAPGCGDTCVVADADATRLLRFSVDPSSGAATALPPVAGDTAIGLSPRSIGRF